MIDPFRSIVQESLHMKITRKTWTMRLRQGMTAGDIFLALGTVPRNARVTSVDGDEGEQTVVFELEEPAP